MAASVERLKASKSSPLFRLRVGFSISLLPMALLVMLYFCQVWWEVAGFTVRSEDVLILLICGGIALRTLAVGKLRYYRHALNRPLLLWCGVLLFGVTLTLLSPFDSVTKKDALINGFRLVLAFSMFYVMYNYPAAARSKMRVIISVVLGFSVITTFVSLLQIGHWDGWLPFSLPPLLTEKAPGANTQPGREIFGLFVGDTSAHAWAAMLALQALTVFVWARRSRQISKKWLGLGYCGVLVLILLRMAVRNSFFGLFAALGGIGLLRSTKSRYPLNRLLKPLMFVSAIALLVLGLLFLAPDTYYVERARAAIPKVEDGRIVAKRASSIYGRLDYYRVAWQMFQDSPLVGHGFYSYQALSGSYGRETVHAHNSYLQVLAESGIIGAIGFGWLLVRIVRETWVIWKRRFYDVEMVLGQELLLGTLIYMLFTAIFANTFGVPQQIGFLMLLLGSWRGDNSSHA